MSETKLNEKTAIPIGLAIVAIGGAATWMTTVHLAVQETRQRQDRQEQRESANTELLREIKERIIIIETEIKKDNRRK